MIGLGSADLELARDELKSDGADDLVRKPFPNRGHTLEKAIGKALGAPPRQKAAPATPRDPRPGATGMPRPFPGGILVLYPGRAELDGVEIIADRGHGYSLRMLEALSQKRDGKFVRIGAYQMARAMGNVGDGQVTGAARRLRQNVKDRLGSELNVECNPSRDFLIRDKHGYHLSEAIAVQRKDAQPAEGTSGAVPPGNVPASDVPAMSPDVPSRDVPATGVPLNDRQEWVLRELKKGAVVRRATVQERFSVADKTAKRDLSDLRQRGFVEYVREGRGGHYRLPQP